MECFTSVEDRIKAAWHAQHIMQLAQQMMALRRNTAAPTERTPHHGPSHNTSQDATETSEPPHFAHAIFYATLILWCNEMLLLNPVDRAERDHPENQSTRTLNLHKGIVILSQSTALVSKVFRQILEGLEASM